MSAFRHDLLDLLPVLRAYALILTRSRSDADDLVQDAVEKAWRAQEQYHSGTNLKAWVFTILRNSFHTSCRRSRRLVQDLDGQHAAALRIEAPQQWSMEYSDVLHAVDQLDDASREQLMMVTAGLSYHEVAIACGVPLRTVQSRVRRARLRLAEILE